MKPVRYTARDCTYTWKGWYGLGCLYSWCREFRKSEQIDIVLMVKQRNLAMLDRNRAKLYLVHPEREPCNVIHDRNPIMLFLVIVPVAYFVTMLKFTFSLLMPYYLYLFLCWKSLGLTQSLWLTQFVSPLFLSFLPPQVRRVGIQLSSDLTKLQGSFMYCLDFSWLWLALLYWGILQFIFMLLCFWARQIF